MKALTREQLLAEIARIERSADGLGVTARDVAEASGKSLAWSQKYIGNEIRAGRCECVGRKAVTRGDGQRGQVPVYVFKR